MDMIQNINVKRINAKIIRNIKKSEFDFLESWCKRI